MIDLVLNKDFVLSQAQLVLDELEAPSGKGARQQIEEKPEDAPRLEEVKGALLEAIEQEPRIGMLVENQEAYVPQNAVLSVLQTVIEERMRETLGEDLRDSKGISDAGPLATKVFLKDPDQFTHRDRKWATSIAKALAERMLRGRYGFVDVDPPPDHQLKDKAKVILLADWGTDNDAAEAVAGLVRQELENAENEQTEAHLIHLGDVYYSGEKWEARDRFLDPWPIKPGEESRWQSWALNGNHDMYSGGYGYFETILGDGRFQGQRTSDDRPCSFFRLHNKHWQILGLDSAWDDHILLHHGRDGFLRDHQGQWVLSRVQNAQGRRTILLTHHQYLSTHVHPHGDFPRKLKPVFDAGGVEAWFWGHEHRCMTFHPRPQVRYAACIGNGGMPEPVGHTRPEQNEWEYNGGHSWRWCGFAVLDMNGEKTAVRYIDQQGTTHHTDSLPEP